MRFMHTHSSHCRGGLVPSSEIETQARVRVSLLLSSEQRQHSLITRTLHEYTKILQLDHVEQPCDHVSLVYRTTSNPYLHYSFHHWQGSRVWGLILASSFPPAHTPIYTAFETIFFTYFWWESRGILKFKMHHKISNAYLIISYLRVT